MPSKTGQTWLISNQTNKKLYLAFGKDDEVPDAISVAISFNESLLKQRCPVGRHEELEPNQGLKIISAHPNITMQYHTDINDSVVIGESQNDEHTLIVISCNGSPPPTTTLLN